VGIGQKEMPLAVAGRSTLPLGGQLHFEVDHAAAIMSQHQEHVQDLEADGGER
jgi:hypothetical protein